MKYFGDGAAMDDADRGGGGGGGVNNQCVSDA